jgi:N-acetylneuraminic acid mutarotase
MRIPLLFVTLALVAQAHFTFIVPDADRKSARLFMSEKLMPDDAVDAKIAKSAKLFVRDSNGHDTPLELTLASDALRMQIPGSGGAQAIHGLVDLGVTTTRGPKPFLLLYHPKTLLAGTQALIGDEQVVEMIPQGEPGNVSLKLIARGKPLAGSEITVILPGGAESKVKTNAEGVAGPFPQTGRFGAWARFWEDGKGQRDGVAYEQVRHYATLVFDAYPKVASTKPLPQATSSFGAATTDGRWLYVYGGHVSKTHTYSTESVSGKFARFDLQSHAWEELPAGPGLQGMNLVAHKGSIYRVGGMEPRNAPGTKQDNHSIADVARFDPASKKWTTLPPLPEARSSHDVAVIGETLFVTGGWNMRGAEPSAWAKTTYALDLKTAAKWEPLPQPFERRAFISAVHDRKLYVIGGITPSGAVSTDVDIYDPSAKSWSKGPKLPGPDITGFAPAAVEHNGSLYVSVGDGRLLRMHGNEWELVANSTPRLAHRMVSDGKNLLIAGGAAKGNNLDLIESVAVN